jgi:hypothetical protein
VARHMLQAAASRRGLPAHASYQPARTSGVVAAAEHPTSEPGMAGASAADPLLRGHCHSLPSVGQGRGGA